MTISQAGFILEGVGFVGFQFHRAYCFKLFQFILVMAVVYFLQSALVAPARADPALHNLSGNRVCTRFVLYLSLVLLLVAALHSHYKLKVVQALSQHECISSIGLRRVFYDGVGDDLPGWLHFAGH